MAYANTLYIWLGKYELFYSSLVRCMSVEHKNQIINNIVSIVLIFIKLQQNILFCILQQYISWIIFLIQVWK
jgi:hypothetical protein